MEFIFIWIKNGLQFLALNEIFVWCAIFGVICLYFVINIFVNPYRKNNRILKKTNAYLRQCLVAKSVPNVGKIVLPKDMAEGLQNYLNSDGKFPGESIVFQQKTSKTKGAFFVFVALAVGFVLLCEQVVYPYVAILLFVFSCLCQVALNGIIYMRHRHGNKICLQTTRLLDKLLGQSKQAKKQPDVADVCIDKEVDDVIAKINFFKQNGINEQTAKEVANLLSDEKLNKIRTQEQQKRLNLALNGLLQVMSKKQQEKQIG